MARRKRRIFSNQQEISIAQQMAIHGNKPTLVFIHGLFSSTNSFESISNHYRNMGYNVINLPSPGGYWGLGRAGEMIPGNENSNRYLDENIPNNSVVIGHSLGGQFTEEWAQDRAQRGIPDNNSYITLHAAFQDPLQDRGARITRIGSSADWVNSTNISQMMRHNFLNQHDINVGGGHSSADWERWVDPINGVILDHQMRSYGGFDPLIEGGSFYEHIAQGGR